jgi:hypothetical protein
MSDAGKSSNPKDWIDRLAPDVRMSPPPQRPKGSSGRGAITIGGSRSVACFALVVLIIWGLISLGNFAQTSGRRRATDKSDTDQLIAAERTGSPAAGSLRVPEPIDRIKIPARDMSLERDPKALDPTNESVGADGQHAVADDSSERAESAAPSPEEAKRTAFAKLICERARRSQLDFQQSDSPGETALQVSRKIPRRGTGSRSSERRSSEFNVMARTNHIAIAIERERTSDPEELDALDQAERSDETFLANDFWQKFEERAPYIAVATINIHDSGTGAGLAADVTVHLQYRKNRQRLTCPFPLASNCFEIPSRDRTQRSAAGELVESIWGDTAQRSAADKVVQWVQTELGSVP